MTLLDLIKQILGAVGIYSPGDSLSTNVTDTVTDALNVMVDSWNAEGLMQYATTRETFTLTVGQGSYTWGTGGNFSTARPTKILEGFIRDGTTDFPLDIESLETYDSIPDKTTPGRPTFMYYDATYPLGTLYFDLIPDNTYGFIVSTEKDLIDFSDLNTEVALPSEYMAALKWNGAAEICPAFLKEVPQKVEMMAEKTLRVVKRINASNNLKPIKQDLFPGKRFRATDGNIFNF